MSSAGLFLFIYAIQPADQPALFAVAHVEADLMIPILDSFECALPLYRERAVLQARPNTVPSVRVPNIPRSQHISYQVEVRIIPAESGDIRPECFLVRSVIEDFLVVFFRHADIVPIRSHVGSPDYVLIIGTIFRVQMNSSSQITAQGMMPFIPELFFPLKIGDPQKITGFLQRGLVLLSVILVLDRPKIIEKRIKCLMIIRPIGQRLPIISVQDGPFL